MKREELVIIICRANLDPKLISPFKAIFPALALLAPISVYSSMAVCIEPGSLYQNLVTHLQKEEGRTCLTQTLRLVLVDKKNVKFRVCVVGGEHIDWEIILEYKRMGIPIDTAGSHPRLSQISYTTGGITREIQEKTIIKLFLTVFGMSQEVRKHFAIQQKKQITFTLECQCCTPSVELKECTFACSTCLNVYCCRKAKECIKCFAIFD